MEQKQDSEIPISIDEQVLVEGKMTVNADKVIVMSSQDTNVDHSKVRVFSVIGTIFGSIFGPVATFFGLIFIACADSENNKVCWKRFTSFTMLGWILFAVLWFGGLYSFGVDALSHAGNSSAKKESVSASASYEVSVSAPTPSLTSVDIVPKVVHLTEVNPIPLVLPLILAPSASPPIHWIIPPWTPPVKKVAAPSSTAPIHKVYRHQYESCNITDECDGNLICVKHYCTQQK